MASSSSSSSWPLALAAVAVLLSVRGASAALNLTEILERGQQYSDFIRLLGQTQQSTQIQNQLNNSRDGVTVFAPTDNAFNNLPAGALNNLDDQQKVSLVQYHVLAKFYTFTTIKTASNPIRTQASSSTGPYYINVTAASNGNQFNVSTGVNTVTVNNALNVTSPQLAVYSIDDVLLPEELFGNKTAAAPAPATAPTGPGSSPSPDAEGPSGGITGATPGAGAGFRVRSAARWIGVVSSVVALGVM